MADDCKFTNLDDQVLDQLAIGLKSKSVIAELLKIDNPTLKTALKKALASEAVNLSAEKLQETCNKDESSSEVHKINMASSNLKTRGNSTRGRGRAGRKYRRGCQQQSWQQRNQQREEEASRERPGERSSTTAGYTAGCYCCGRPGHYARNCRYNRASCNICQRRGHLSNVCSSRRSGETHEKKNSQVGYLRAKNADSDSDDSLNKEIKHMFSSEQTRNVHCIGTYMPGNTRVEPQFLPVKINNTELLMEMDTGAALSIISVATKSKYFQGVKLHNADVTLLNHDESPYIPVGMLKNIIVEANGVEIAADVYVTKSNGPAIIGRPWLKALNLWPLYAELRINKIETDNYKDKLKETLKKNEAIFSKEKGSFTKGEVKLELKENSKPIYVQARTVPFALKEKIEHELDRLVKEGTMEPVEESEWATPIVPVLKQNGEVRICADFKVTVNPQLITVRHPAPSFDHAIANLQGGEKYSKIDLKEAYLQMPVAEESQPLLTINTHKGLFRYRYMAFGISSAPGIFQLRMEEILKGIPGVAVVVDNIVVTGQNTKQHLERLDKVLTKLNECGLKVRVDKCQFFKDKITYLGYQICKNEISIDPAKYQAIVEMKNPENKPELELVLGKINYYNRLLKNRAAILKPLYECKNRVEFVWDQACELSFRRVKEELKSIVVNYDPQLPIILTCDASPRGLAAYLSQPYSDRDRLVACASKGLTKAQVNYSQIDREAAAIIFGISKFYDYLYAREFTLRTDNKPLSRIFGPNKGIPRMATSRLQNWAHFLSAFSYKIECIRSEENIVADAFSRLPGGKCDKPCEKEIEVTYLHYVVQSESVNFDYKTVARKTAKDKLFSMIKRCVEQGWPESKIKNWKEELKPFVLRKDELSVERGCLMWGHRVLIPPKLQGQVIQKLHECHFGIVRMKSVARSVVWWPRIDSMLEEKAKSCTYCAQVSDNPKKMALTPWPWPDQPWQRLHADFAGPFLGHTYFLLIDAHSKWPEIFIVKNLTAKATIDLFKKIFAIHGLPLHVVTDSGTQFVSEECKVFFKQLGIKQTFTTPRHPATNGAAENFVKTFKRKIKAMVESENISVQIAIERFLFAYRSSKHTITGESPAKLLFNRELRKSLDLLRPDIKVSVKMKQEMQIKNYRGKRVDQYLVGDVILARDFRKNYDVWSEAKIVQILSPCNYLIKFKEGEGVHKRHGNQIKPWQELGTYKYKNDIDESVNNDTSITEANLTVLRRSNRNTKPVQRYCANVHFVDM